MIWKPGDRVTLISFDIDGTLEVGDPPGVIPLEVIRRAKALGFVVGSCSDRTIRVQEELWARHDLTMDFVVVKQGLADVKVEFSGEYHLHVGDSPVDEIVARQAGFTFLHAMSDDVIAFLEEHELHS